MIARISQAERLDILLVMALALAQSLPNAEKQTAVKLAKEKFNSLGAEDLKMMQSRARLFDRLSAEEQKIWQAGWLELIRRRGKTLRLDEHINPAQVTKVLRSETKTIQELVLRNLPVSVSAQVTVELGLELDFPVSSITAKPGQLMIKDEILDLIREKFLSHFVALEDIFNQTEADKFSISELSAFIRQLGVRETAIGCRGITSKESLAAFLARFDELDAREIAGYLTELEKINPFWVAEADRLVRQTLDENFETGEFLHNLGLQLLALGFVGREPVAQQYTAQKMRPAEAEKWLDYLRKYEDEYSSASNDELARLEKRQRIFERLAEKFSQRKRD